MGHRLINKNLSVHDAHQRMVFFSRHFCLGFGFSPLGRSCTPLMPPFRLTLTLTLTLTLSLTLTLCKEVLFFCSPLQASPLVCGPQPSAPDPAGAGDGVRHHPARVPASDPELHPPPLCHASMTSGYHPVPNACHLFEPTPRSPREGEVCDPAQLLSANHPSFPASHQLQELSFINLHKFMRALLGGGVRSASPASSASSLMLCFGPCKPNPTPLGGRQALAPREPRKRTPRGGGAAIWADGGFFFLLSIFPLGRMVWFPPFKPRIPPEGGKEDDHRPRTPQRRCARPDPPGPHPYRRPAPRPLPAAAPPGPKVGESVPRLFRADSL